MNWELKFALTFPEKIIFDQIPCLRFCNIKYFLMVDKPIVKTKLKTDFLKLRGSTNNWKITMELTLQFAC